MFLRRVASWRMVVPKNTPVGERKAAMLEKVSFLARIESPGRQWIRKLAAMDS